MATSVHKKLVETMLPIINEITKNLPSDLSVPNRLFHGRGNTIPGYEFLTIDWYPPIVLVTLYRTVDQPFLTDLGQVIDDLLGEHKKGVVVQDRTRKTENSLILSGSCPDELIIVENGLRYRVRPLSQQNIGFFPDMKCGRQLTRDISSGQKVLNLFAYTCGFSVAALAGGATRVVNVDMNRNLLDWGRENHRLNDHDLRNVSFIPHNLFKSFGRLKKLAPFDLVIIDPPYRQGSNFQAERDWPKILRRLPDLLTPGGEIVAAVSAPELGRSFLCRQFSEQLPGARLEYEMTAGDNFPEADPDKGLHIQHYRL